MALLKCCECGKEVSEYAETCPNCGCEVSKIKESILIHNGNKVKCCECGQEVSEHAVACPNCGCPMSKIKESILLHDETKLACRVNGKVMDVTWIRDELLLLDSEKFDYYKFYCSPELDAPKVWQKHVHDKYFFEADDLYEKIYKSLNLSFASARQFMRQFIESDFTLKEFNGQSFAEMQEERRHQERISSPRPHCPYCGSLNVERLSFTQKAVSIGSLGILSNKIGKTYQCRSCKSTW